MPGTKELKKRLMTAFFFLLRIELAEMERLTVIITYSPTDNFLSPIAVSDWSIFCCGNSILHQKNKMIKIKFSDEVLRCM